MTTYGTKYGGWWLPDNFVPRLVVSAGVGEDISFDLAIQAKFGCTIELVDPTERAITHWEEVKYYYNNKTPFTGSIQPDYLACLPPNPDLSKIHMNPVGLWSEEGTLKFYKQENPSYVSQSLVPNLFGTDYTMVPVKRLSTLLEEKGITEIDILKLDIEGAEMQVLETMLEDGIRPKILCVEFDYYLKGGDISGETKELIKKLFKAGYKMRYNANWNIIFELC